jgi:hypothetical protein
VNWKLVVGLGLTGSVIGLLSVFVGLPSNSEFALWTVLYLLWVAAVVRARAPRPVLTMATAGAIAGLCAGALQTLFLEQYKANNPLVATTLPAAPAEAAAGFIVFGVLAGVLFGLIFGTLAAIWMRRYPAEPA